MFMQMTLKYGVQESEYRLTIDEADPHSLG